jgi:hypothetical protein
MRFAFTVDGISGAVHTETDPTVYLHTFGAPIYNSPVLYQKNSIPDEPDIQSENIFNSLDWNQITECRRLGFHGEDLLRVSCQGHTFELKRSTWLSKRGFSQGLVPGPHL